MSRRVLSGLPNDVGADWCPWVNLRSILRYFGYSDYNESILASRWDFAYSRAKRHESQFTSIRSHDDRYSGFARAGFTLAHGTSDDAEGSWKNACLLIDDGIPVIVRVDYFYLPNYPYPAGSEKHVPHNIILHGYETGHSAWILDVWPPTAYAGAVPFGDLIKARNSVVSSNIAKQEPPYDDPIANRYMYITPPPTPVTHEAIVTSYLQDAITRLHSNDYNGEAYLSGYDGIHAFANDLHDITSDRIHEEYDSYEWLFLKLYTTVHQRMLAARLIDEAALAAKFQRLSQELSLPMKTLVRSWRIAHSYLLKCSLTNDRQFLDRARDSFHQAGDQEAKVFKQLSNLFSLSV